MSSLINVGATEDEQRATRPARCTLNIAHLILVFAIVCLSSCSEKKGAAPKSFYNIDSLVTIQVQKLKGSELTKSVEIDSKSEQTKFVPDSAQWASELEIFRQLAQVNKAAFRDAYVVSDTRDTNSNLTVREIKAQREVPVSMVRLYYLRTPADLRRVEATFVEENTLYTNTRKMVMELQRYNNVNLLHRYRIESLQKFIMDDSVRFTIAGEVGI